MIYRIAKGGYLGVFSSFGWRLDLMGSMGLSE
jgi:hypothetical protein